MKLTSLLENSQENTKLRRCIVMKDCDQRTKYKNDEIPNMKHKVTLFRMEKKCFHSFFLDFQQKAFMDGNVSKNGLRKHHRAKSNRGQTLMNFG